MTELGLVVVGALLAGAGAAAAAAAAAFHRVELAQWVASRLRGRSRASGLTAFPREIIATTGALSAIGVLVMAVGIPVLTESLGVAARAAVTLAIVVPVAVVVADVIPRTLGRRAPERTLRAISPLLRVLRFILGPLVPARDPGLAGDVAALLRASGVSGGADADELGVVTRVLSFADRCADDVMTPRTRVVAVADGTPAAEVGRVVAESGYSRLPVYRESLDDVVGMIHALDLLKLRPDAAVPVRPVVHVPERCGLNDLLLEMQRERCHLAVVLDEFGGTKGIVTLDDLLDELVGEVTSAGEDATGGEGPGMPLHVDGATPLSAVEGHFGVSLGALHGAESVGGYLASALGRIPRTGERFEAPGLEFDVLGASATRLERVVIRPAPVHTERLPQRERTS